MNNMFLSISKMNIKKKFNAAKLLKRTKCLLDLSFQSGDTSATTDISKSPKREEVQNDISKSWKREDVRNDQMSVRDISKPISFPNQEPYSNKLPPLEDPSVILKSPSGTLQRHQRLFVGKTYILLYSILQKNCLFFSKESSN